MSGRSSYSRRIARIERAKPSGYVAFLECGHIQQISPSQTAHKKMLCRKCEAAETGAVDLTKNRDLKRGGKLL